MTAGTIASTGVGSLYGATLEVPAGPRRGECSDFVDLARRMNITPDDAIREFMEFSRRHPSRRSRGA